jgi:CheY-like chemotaxis protein
VEGTGLGMNITMQLLKLMGSELCVTSEYGKGSVFSFHIYQKIVNPEPLGNFQFKAALASSEQPYESAYTAPEAKILVVDDNEMNLEVFRCLLKKTKMQIREAASGRECLKLLETEQFHIIFLDHMMPEMDGIETFHIMKQRSLCPNTPVIMLTANAISGAREQYLNEGFHDFLAKPVLLNKLDTLILKYLPKELVKFDSSKEETPVLTDKEAKFLQALPITEGFDFDHAMNLLGSKEILAHVLSEFYEYLPRALDKLTQYMDTLSKPQTLPLYRAEIHTLKDSANTVGASVIFRLARLLEEAAEENNMEKIQKLHPILIESMSKCRNRLSAILLCSQEQS